MKKTGLAHFWFILRRALHRNRREAVIIVLTAVGGLVVTGWILSNQTQFNSPSWFPGAAETYEFEAEFGDATGLLPGTAQPVAVAGVQVGVVKDVQVDDQSAVVTVEVDDEDLEVYEDATLLLRPRTALKDMFVALEPGTPVAGELENGGRIPVGQTQPGVDVQEILANLDTDTRSYVRLLLAGAAQGLGASDEPGDEGVPDPAAVKDLGATLRQFDPFAENARLVVEELGERRRNLKHAVTGLSQVMTELGAVNVDIARLVDGSNRAFAALGSEDEQLVAALDELPPTLQEVDTALASTVEFGRQLRISTGNLRGFARALAPAERALQPFATETLPIVRDQLRPFARQTLPIFKRVRVPITRFADAAPGLVTTTDVLNGFFNALANNPAGAEEGYLFHYSWLSHILPSLASIQDAHGAALRGLPMLTCPQFDALNTVEAANPILSSITRLANLPDETVFC